MADRKIAFVRQNFRARRRWSFGTRNRPPVVPFLVGVRRSHSRSGIYRRAAGPAQVAEAVARNPARPARLFRVADIAVGICVLLWTLPVTAVAATALALSGARPVFERAERIDSSGRRFRRYRFRCRDVSDETTIGRFIFRTRIAEIPGLIHVVTGETSLFKPAGPAAFEGVDET